MHPPIHSPHLRLYLCRLFCHAPQDTQESKHTTHEGMEHTTSDACRSHRKRQKKRAETQPQEKNSVSSSSVTLQDALSTPSPQPSKAIKQSSIFETWKLPSVPPQRVVTHEELTRAVAWFIGHRAGAPRKRLRITTLTGEVASPLIHPS